MYIYVCFVRDSTDSIDFEFIFMKTKNTNSQTKCEQTHTRPDRERVRERKRKKMYIFPVQKYWLGTHKIHTQKEKARTENYYIFLAFVCDDTHTHIGKAYEYKPNVFIVWTANTSYTIIQLSVDCWVVIRFSVAFVVCWRTDVSVQFVFFFSFSIKR